MASETGKSREEKPATPNAFLAVQVHSPDIHQRLVDVAGKILDYDDSLAWALEPVVKSHVTLLGQFVLTLILGREIPPYLMKRSPSS